MPHILLIEDYRDNREVAKLILNDAGFASRLLVMGYAVSSWPSSVTPISY